MLNDEELVQARRANLKRWLLEKNMSQAELSRKVGLTKSYISLLNRRHFGEKAARKMEEMLSMPNGFLDMTSEGPKVIDDWDKPSDLPADVYALVPRLAVQLSAGNGCHPNGEKELPPLAFRRDWLQKRSVTSKKNLRVVSVHGDSMSPFLMDMDIVLIDTGQTTIQDNEVYAIVHGGDLRVKRLMKTFSGGLRIRSDNPAYPEEVLSASDAEAMSCIGKVLWRAG